MSSLIEFTSTEIGSRFRTYSAGACTITRARYCHVASPALRATSAAISRSGGRARGVKRGPAGGRGSIRSTRKVRQSSRSASQATRYQRRRSFTKRYGSTVRRLAVPEWVR